MNDKKLAKTHDLRLQVKAAGDRMQVISSSLEDGTSVNLRPGDTLEISLVDGSVLLRQLPTHGPPE